jgi:folate-binding protein YgfZ
LQGVVTGEMTTMKAGEGCFTAACNRQGKMVGVMTVHLQEDQILLEVDRSNMEGLKAHFDRYIIMEDVALTDLSQEWSIFELQGVGSWKALSLPPLPWYHHVGWKNGVVSSNCSLGQEGVTLLLPSEEKISFEEGSQEEYEDLRVANGFPKWGVDMGPEELPMEAGLECLAISYSKGCYLGQEVILRVRNFGEPPKQLVLLKGDGLVAGAEINVGDEIVGKVTSRSKEVALGYVKKKWKAPGTTVEVDGISAVVSSLPWQKDAVRPPDREQGTVSKV